MNYSTLLSSASQIDGKLAHSMLAPQYHGASPTAYYVMNNLTQMMQGSKNVKEAQDEQEFRTREVNVPKKNRFPVQNVYGYSPLHVAACLGQALTANSLLENISESVDINQQDHNGNTALMWAASEGSEDIVQLLVDNGADLNVQNFKGETALFLAASRGFHRICSYLLETGASPNLPNLEESTPVHIAASSGHLEVLSILVKHGAHFNAQDEEGDTPLHYAVREGHESIVKFLVSECKANVFIRNEDGETALELAACLQENSIQQFLSEAEGSYDQEDNLMLF